MRKKVLPDLANVAILIQIAALLAGCDKTNTTGSVDNDAVLAGNLVGKWKSGNDWKIQFNSDGTFADTIINRSFPDTTKVLFTEVFAGKYSIQNSVLSYYEYHHQRLPDSMEFGGSYEWLNNLEIQVNGDILSCTPVSILSPALANNVTLDGTWNELVWAHTHLGFPTPGVYDGWFRLTYTFNKDSLSYTQTFGYADSAGGITTKAGYTYTPPTLTLSSVFRYRVEFKNGKMYWYSPPPSSVLYRIR